MTENNLMHNVTNELNENLEEVIGKLKTRNAFLEGRNILLEEENIELKKKNNKLLEQIEMMKAEKLFEKAANSEELNSQQMKRKNLNNLVANIHAKKLKLLRRRFIPNWIIEVLEWIKRMEMADSSLSISSEIFKQLCWPKLHLNVKPHEIPELKYSEVTYEQGKWRAPLEKDEPDYSMIPTATIPPPNYIVGVRQMGINIVDDEVMNFAKCIAHLLENCLLHFSGEKISCNIDTEHLESMKTLLESLAAGGKIYQINLFNGWYHGWYLNLFVQKFPAGTLDCVQFLKIDGGSIYDIDILMNWLTNRTNIGKQKVIHICSDCTGFKPKFIEEIKKEFSNSNLPSNFLIRFRSIMDSKHSNNSKNIDEFTLENERTNEILTLYCKKEFHYKTFYLARYPKGEEHWKEEGELKISWRQGTPKLHTIRYSHE